MIKSFSPKVNGTVSINVSASSQSVKVATRNSPVVVRVMNNGTATVWISWGGSTALASMSTGVPVGPGVHEVITMNPGIDGDLYIAAIAVDATGSVYFTPGEGM